jgi:hypothetical protein
MLDGVLLSLQTSGLAEWQGDALVLSPDAVASSPSDKTLRNVERFYLNPPEVNLRGRRKHGRLRPAYLLVLQTYYRNLYNERANGILRGEASASARALERTAKECRFQTPEACAKVLEKARSLYPELVKLWKGKGFEAVRSE